MSQCAVGEGHPDGVVATPEGPTLLFGLFKVRTCPPGSWALTVFWRTVRACEGGMCCKVTRWSAHQGLMLWTADIRYIYIYICTYSSDSQTP